jgi:hypothetical protein
MIVGAHQSHFLPWLGYLDRIRRSDVFIVVDHVQFERQNFQNRNRIKTRNGAAWLIVPVRQFSRAEVIYEKQIDNSLDGKITWGERMMRMMDNVYGKAPYYAAHRPFLADVLGSTWQRLVDLNDVLLKYFLDQLEIRTPVVKSSSLGRLEGARSEMVLRMCQAVGADTYLSGTGGSQQYLDIASFEASGIRVEWQRFEHPEYPQLRPPNDFLPQMAVVDVLFNCGPASAAVLRGEHVMHPAEPPKFRRAHALTEAESR